ncbi:hypothetical protein BU26DRAFT_515207 [Trematosphaeria pertusa]|uniref:Uncharacterized protein n=1 Tax=Trematosphaeria pertusa TaxID=390896 RepID=A0A6A6IRF2_9PLEO|nr:uncharacterized protein BU26DRAFT_515207 [Trematosphaeria pertusa]KAF2252747.1 hypothetical protein BU26DRAFT_515207 [Trematosphaeria pertusa]
MVFEHVSDAQAAVAVGLLTVLAGYIGSDIAPDTLIERMLWPQRSNNGFGARSTLKYACLLPAGGPLHRLALKTMDTFFKHSLHKGAGRGHMLGTAFFPDTGIAYKMHPGNGQPAEDELVRNGLLVRILKCIPYIASDSNDDQAATTRVRQQITVSHLELFNFETIPPQGAITLDDDVVNAKTLFAIVATELPAIILALLVSATWSSLAGLLFLAPLVLKVVAALTTIEREDLIIPHDREKASWDDVAMHPKFEIHIPGEGFQVVSGPAELVLPFFRHYGHPIRCRWREITQMLIIAATGFCYPTTAALMVLFMPLQVQTVWAAYQVYVIFAMLAARYGEGELWGTTEERVGKALVESEKYAGEGMVVLKNRTGEMVGMRLKRTVHGSYSAGKTQVARIVSS